MAFVIVKALSMPKSEICRRPMGQIWSSLEVRLEAKDIRRLQVSVDAVLALDVGRVDATNIGAVELTDCVSSAGHSRYPASALTSTALRQWFLGGEHGSGYDCCHRSCRLPPSAQWKTR